VSGGVRGASVRGFRALSMAIVVGALLSVVLPLRVSAQTPQRPEVTALRFEGNQTFSGGTLANAILTRPTECKNAILLPFCWAGREFALTPAFFNARTFDFDHARVLTFYRRQGFRQVEVDTVLVRPTPTTIEITFRIREGEPVRVGTFDVQGVEDPSLLAGLPIRAGDRLNLMALQVAADTLTERLQNRGYPQAEVFRDVFVPRGSLEGEVLLDVFPGPAARFGPIEVAGQVEVSEAVIRRMIPFEEGSPYSRDALFDAQRNLYGMEIFRQATVLADLAYEPDSIVPIRVQVAEGNTRGVRAGGGWNTADCFATEARWASRNFYGGGRRVVLRGRVSNVLTPVFSETICSGAGSGDYAKLDWLLSADLTQPWLLSPRNTLTVGLFAERQSVPDIFIREALGTNLSLTRIVGRNSPMTLSWQPQLRRLAAAEVFFCTNFLVCNSAEISILESANRLSPLTLRFVRDRTDRAIAPTRGFTLATEVEVAGAFTLSDFAYRRAVLEWTGFHALTRDLVLAARLRGGWIGASEFKPLSRSASTDLDANLAISPPEKRFYAGGANSVRGYGQGQLGPRVVTVPVQTLLFPYRGEGAAVCSPERVASLLCDAGALDAAAFDPPRPTGGSTVFEGNLELRFPIWDPFVSGVAFADVGQVWSEPDAARLREAVVSPGIGLRYWTPIGPVRLDLAYRPEPFRSLPVVTQRIRPFDPEADPASSRIQGPDGTPIDWVLLDELARLGPRVSFDDGSRFSIRRVQFQFSIGHAF
jgi:outer membrane protein insertion porin family